MWLWKLLEKMNFFTCDFQTLLWLHFGGSKTFFLFVCISRIFYNLRNHNVVKHSLVENRIFRGLYDFVYQHESLIKSMCTSCKNSKSTSVEVEESGVKCRVILFQMSNYLSCISTYDNCIWIVWIIKFALEKYFLFILSKLYSTMRRRMVWWNWWKSEATFERRSSLSNTIVIDIYYFCQQLHMFQLWKIK